jgi:uncharacterized protein (TIGR00369 family)
MAITADSFRTSLARTFSRAVPHVGELGIVIDHIDAEGALAHLPYRDEWLGDSARGIIHTGLITTLVDSISGIALLSRLGAFEAIATLDLRMDYLRPALRDKPLHCRAHCHRLTAHIAFVNASVWQDRADEPVAQSQSAFMRSSHSPRRSPGAAS